MVGPVSDVARATFVRRLKVALILIVGASAGLVAFANGASVSTTAVMAVGGLIVGILLVWTVFPTAPVSGANR